MALSCIDSDQITDVKVRDDLLDLIGNSTCEGMTQDFYTAISVMYILLYNNLTGQNNCWKNWIKCAGKLAACAAECMNNTTSQSCISCLTPLYSECKYCFSEIEESQKSGNKCNTLSAVYVTVVIGIYITAEHKHSCSELIIVLSFQQAICYEFQVSEHSTCMDS